MSPHSTIHLNNEKTQKTYCCSCVRSAVVKFGANRFLESSSPCPASQSGPFRRGVSGLWGSGFHRWRRGASGWSGLGYLLVCLIAVSRSTRARNPYALFLAVAAHRRVAATAVCCSEICLRGSVSALSSPGFRSLGLRSPDALEVSAMLIGGYQYDWVHQPRFL